MVVRSKDLARQLSESRTPVGQFDAWVGFEETTAVTPLPARHATGIPGTYPFGM